MKKLFELFDGATLTDEEIMDFCKFGVQTSAGFQRIPALEDYRTDYDLLFSTSGYKGYKGK